MELSADQILLYGGALLAVAALVLLAGFLLYFHMAARHLKSRLDAEYGKPTFPTV